VTRFRKWMLSLRKLTYNKPTLEIDKNGTKRWLLPNDKFHRVDGPALEYPNGTKAWYLNGKFHRVDGPAVEHACGDKLWWLNGKSYFFDDWLEVNKHISEEEKLMLKLAYG
jgi:hypothetical protein